MPRRILPGLLFLIATQCPCESSPPPALTGYVTRVVSATDFDVDGTHILLDSKTQIRQASPTTGKIQNPPTGIRGLKPYIGQAVDIYGKATPKTRTIDATQIVLYVQEPRPVSGIGIIDATLPLPASASPVSDRLIRADGYPILINAHTATTFDQPLSLPSEIDANVWVVFSGMQQADGIVIADRASFSRNSVSHGEDHLRKKSEYDPAAVAADKKQTAISKAFRGIDVTQIPPYQDAAMQARVSSIGAKLVPKYQSDMPPRDESRIDFRFHVIDSTKWRDAVTLENGIILVPRQVVERMQNDSELAAVLADNIACALEKQPLGGHTDATKMTTADLIGDAAGFVVPGLGLATSLATGSIEARINRLRREQSGRVSLALLHDAGYDISQAPLAWWLLAPKKPKDLADTPIPQRAQYLYWFLGETWPPSQP